MGLLTSISHLYVTTIIIISAAAYSETQVNFPSSIIVVSAGSHLFELHLAQNVNHLRVKFPKKNPTDHLALDPGVNCTALLSIINKFNQIQ